MPSDILSITLFVFAALNVAAFLIMLWDKSRARRSGTERISEGMLFFLAVIGGSLGVYAGMFAFRHKTRKWYFLLGIPLVFVQNLALIYFISLSLK